MTAPVRFVFGLHLHQPVGNFDHVFAQHVEDVYDPLLRQLEAGGLVPAVLHVSGPLLDWLETHAPRWVDRLGRLAADGRVELLAAGYYEPILASLPRRDRVEQVLWLREAIRRRFGVSADGLWLTERVWEPELAADLADAGIRYALVDDRHFLVSGFARETLHAWHRTESDGRGVALFPIDERLRYLIPFRPPEECAAYLRELRDAGHGLAVLADDGEKFGGWPGTKRWVYEEGWFARFVEMLGALQAEGVVRLSTLAEAFEAVPSAGLAYLPTASYREMEGWALPSEPQGRLERLQHDLGARLDGPDGALVRGGHWRHFLAKYAESNRLHKMMCALSAECRAAGDPEEARRAIGRAQCNDAYWHGVFGGLYLPFLRDALWRELARAERVLRAGRDAALERRDLDQDGHEECWLRGPAGSVVVAPSRGGAIEAWLDHRAGRNLADTLTRRREAYHLAAAERGEGGAHANGGTASIHDLEQSLRLSELPPVDPHVRAIGVERVLAPGTPLDAIVSGTAEALRSWADAALRVTAAAAAGALEVTLEAADGSLTKRIRYLPDGALAIELAWRGETCPAGAECCSELSFALGHDVALDAPDARVERHPIETVAKSERGLDRTVQGEALLLRWPAGRGRGAFTLRPPA